MKTTITLLVAVIVAVGCVSGVAVPENGANDPGNTWTYQQCMDAFGEIKEAHPSNTQESWNKCTGMCQKNWYDSDRPRYVRCYYCCLVKPRPAPVLESVTPSQGYSTLGGDFVVIKGNYFGTEEKTNGEPDIIVTFGGIAAKGCKAESPTKITCETPPGKEGKTSVVVSVDGIKSEPKDAFTYPRQFRTCEEVKEAHKKARSGVYKLKDSNDRTVEAYCDMDSVGGGWTRCFKQSFSGANNWARTVVGKDVKKDNWKGSSSNPLPSLDWIHKYGCPEITNKRYTFLVKGYINGKLTHMISDVTQSHFFVQPKGSCHAGANADKCPYNYCFTASKVYSVSNPASTAAVKTLWGAESRTWVSIPRDCKTPGVKSASSFNSFYWNGSMEYSFHTKDHFRRAATMDNNSKAPQVFEFYIR